MSAPTTAAGKALLEDGLILFNEPESWRLRIVAIETQAAEQANRAPLEALLAAHSDAHPRRYPDNRCWLCEYLAQIGRAALASEESQG